MLGALTAPVDTRTPAKRAADLAQLFGSPKRDARPKTNWFFPYDLSAVSQDQIDREAKAIADAGIGRASLYTIDRPLTADLMQLWKHVLEAAKRHGILLDLFIGGGGASLTAPSLTDRLADQQELVYGAAALHGGQTFHGLVPVPQTDPSRPRRLVAVIGARCSASCSGGSPVLLEQDSLVDMTDSTNGAEIAWTTPRGHERWLLFGFWRRPATPYFSPGPTADYFSAAGTHAVTEYWDQKVLTPELRALVRDVVVEVYEDSLHLEGFQLWTRNFLSEFECRRGYSIRKYLPVTVIPYLNDFFTNLYSLSNSLSPSAPAAFDFDGDAGRRIRNDYYQTLTELYEEHHLTRMNRWAHSHGLGYSAKPGYGQSLDISSGTAIDVPETESLQFGNRTDAWRAMAGVVHLGRKSTLSFECGQVVTQSGQDIYSTTWQQMLNVIHGAFAAGVNEVRLHGIAYRDEPGAPWPGHAPFRRMNGLGYGEAFGPRMPYWQHMRDITDFLGREQTVLRRGQPKVDLAIYRHSYWSQGFPTRASHVPRDDWFKDKTLERAGYSYDFVAPALFDRPNATIGGGRLDPGGPAYKALILNASEQVNSVAGMTLATANRILEYVREGLPVVMVGEGPDRTGFFGDVSEDASVKRKIVELLTEPNVHQVATEEQVAAILADLGLDPDFAPVRPSNVVSAHRSDGETHFYFLYNRSAIDAISGEHSPEPKPFDQPISLAGVGQPYQLDAWTGGIKPIACWTGVDGRVETRMALKPGQSTIIALCSGGRTRRAPQGDPPYAERTTAEELAVGHGGELWARATKAGQYRTRLSNGTTVQTTIPRLPEAKNLSRWHLSVEDWRPGAPGSQTLKVKHELDLDSLKPWPQIPELEDVSGVGRYLTEVELDDGWVTETQPGWRVGVRLALGPIVDSVRVRVNDKRAPIVDRFDPVIDITRLVGTGTNRIEIEVATTLRNRLRTLAAYPDFEEVDRQPYGLSGPVQLIPVGEALINAHS